MPGVTSTDLQENGFAYHSSVVFGEALEVLRFEALQGNARRTTLSHARQHEWWTEHAVTKGSALWGILAGELAQRYVREVCGRDVSHTQAWVHLYAVGERIPWHRDADGDLQMLLCLSAPPPENGGIFLLRHDGKEHRLTNIL